MKVIAVNGSPREDGNTSAALKIMAEELKKEGITVETVNIGHLAVRGCTACGYCASSENNECVFKDDPVNETAAKIREADGFIIASPTYYAGIAGTMKSFLDRLFYSSSRHFKYKVAAAVTAVRRTGGIDTLHQLKNYLDLAQTVTPPSQYGGIRKDRGRNASGRRRRTDDKKKCRSYGVAYQGYLRGEKDGAAVS